MGHPDIQFVFRVCFPSFCFAFSVFASFVFQFGVPDVPMRFVPLFFSFVVLVVDSLGTQAATATSCFPELQT